MGPAGSMFLQDIKMIEIQELTFKYAGAKNNALNNISLKIEKGDFVGIIGESGAGKTTLCNCMNALIPHHYRGDFYGSVKIDGTDTFDTDTSKLALKVGSVFQDIESQLVSSFVEEEILFGLENFGIPADQIESRISSALEDLGITELRHREISSLSGGQKQKVVIAAILAIEPGSCHTAYPALSARWSLCTTLSCGAIRSTIPSSTVWRTASSSATPAA